MIKYSINLLTLLLSMWLVTASASSKLDHDEALRLSQSGQILSFQTLLNDADKRYPQSHLLEVKLKQKHGRFVYKVELLTPAKEVRKLRYDAQSGELLKDEGDD